MFHFDIETHRRICCLDITQFVKSAVRDSEIDEGVVCVFVPHTTAGVIINEGADPDVVKDIEKKLASLIPERENYAHSEGNSDAHIKAVLTGNSLSIPFADNSLSLRTWQKIFFCEFDGPRKRSFYVGITASK